MQAFVRSAGLLGSASVLLMSGVAPASASNAAAPRWRVSYVSSNSTSFIADVVAPSARDVWAAGDIQPPGPLTGQRALVRRWNGRSWAAARLPSKFSHATIFTVAASSPSDVWVFGQWRNSNGLDGHAFALRWTGSWSVAGFWKTFSDIRGAVVFGPQDAWIFGSIGVRHFNGHGWKTFTLPYTLNRASAVSGNDIWAVGADNATGAPVLSRWHSGKWTARPLPVIASSPPGPALLDVVARSDRNVWVVGGRVNAHGGLRPVAMHWHSGTWKRSAVAGVDFLGRVIPDGNGGLWAAFQGPFDSSRLAHFTAGAWHLVRLPVLTGKATSAFAVALVPRSAVAYAAGSTVFGGLPETNALILRFSR